jgi:single-strand DNA-binding protein
MGENCAQYLDKGRSVYVEGRLTTRTWDDKNTGEKKYRTEIIATSVVFLADGKGGGRRDDAPPREEGDAPGGKKGSGGPGGSEDFGPPGGGDDDIPF